MVKTKFIFPEIPLVGIGPKKSETLTRKNVRAPMFIAAQFAIAKIWKQPQCPPADEGIKCFGAFIPWNTM